MVCNISLTLCEQDYIFIKALQFLNFFLEKKFNFFLEKKFNFSHPRRKKENKYYHKKINLINLDSLPSNKTCKI